MTVINPSRPDPGRKEKINLNFYFETSSRCFKRFYEGFRWRSLDGCKDQVLVKCMILENCIIRQRNLSIAGVHYKKAFTNVLQKCVGSTVSTVSRNVKHYQKLFYNLS